jgi:hypothetical protein
MKKETRDTFPLIIKKGFAVVKIYEITHRKRKDRDGNAYKIYTVSYVGPNGEHGAILLISRKPKVKRTSSRDQSPASTRND